MKSESSAWAFLRPLLLVVAATAAWIALSAAGASADSSSRDLVPEAVNPTAANLSHQATDELEPVLAGLDGGPATAAASTAGAVAAVVDPAVGAVDGVAGGTVGAAVPLAETVLEPLNPVLEPVVYAVTLPAVGPETGPGEGLPVTTDVGAASAPEPAPGPPPGAELPQATGGVMNPAQSGAMSQSSSAENRLQMMRAAVTPVLSKAGPEDAPFHAPPDTPAVPGAAVGGSGQFGGNGPAAPGWISPYHFAVPAEGMAAIKGRSLTAPAPVSFDPGSSPD